MMGKSLVFFRVNAIAAGVILFLCLPSTATPVAGDDSDSRDNRQKLAAFARKTRLARPTSTGSSQSETIHITNENLARTGEPANLTQVTDSPDVTSMENDPGGAQVATSVDQKNQQIPQEDQVLQLKRDYWRNRYLATKADLAAAENEVISLDEEMPKLWTRFYTTDEPANRDSVVKPRLDAALNRRESLTKQIEVLQHDLAKILGDAKADGALPGWFRDIK